MTQSEIRHRLLCSGIARLCWSDAGPTAEYGVTRVPNTNDEINVVRMPSTGGHQTRLVRQPPGTSDTGFMLTNGQWAVLCEIADA